MKLVQICLSNKKADHPEGSLTTRTIVDHIEVAEKIVKRFQRKTDAQDPFLKAKLKHIVKRMPNNHQHEE